MTAEATDVADPEFAKPWRPQDRRRRRLGSKWIGWVFVGPAVLGSLIFNLLPMLPTFALSFSNWDGGFGSLRWVGWSNYQNLFTDRYFIESVQRTIVFTIAVVGLSMAFGLGLALMVQGDRRSDIGFRTAYFLPFVTSQVAIGVVWKWIFDSNFGPLNEILGTFGIDGPNWLLDPSLAMFAVIIVSSWFFMGYNMVLFLAGLKRIPAELTEAANIDGAGPVERFFKITLPLLSPTTFAVLLINVIIVFEVFGLIFVMTDGGPGTATEIYMFRLYREAFEFFHLGYASAMAWILVTLLAGLSLIQIWAGKKWVFYQ